MHMLSTEDSYQLNKPVLSSEESYQIVMHMLSTEDSYQLNKLVLYSEESYQIVMHMLSTEDSYQIVMHMPSTENSYQINKLMLSSEDDRCFAYKSDVYDYKSIRSLQQIYWCKFETASDLYGRIFLWEHYKAPLGLLRRALGELYEIDFHGSVELFRRAINRFLHSERIA